MPLYNISQLSKEQVEYDFIIIGENENSVLFRNSLINRGILPNKILDWGILKEFLCENNIEVLKKRKTNYEGLVCGMSHSYWGVLTYRLCLPFFKLSLPALDLYYIEKQLNEVLNENYFKNKLKHEDCLKCIVLEMPYYYFNYDLSMNKAHMRRQLVIADYFDDFHNYGNQKEERDIISEYYIWKELFYKRMRCTEQFCLYDRLDRKGCITETMKTEVENNLSHVWRSEHIETIRENINIFNRILSKIEWFDKSIKIVINVMPQSKYLEEYHPKEIDSTRCFFYNVVQEYSERIQNDVYLWDDFDLYYENDSMFLDCIHLNSMGAISYTDYLSNMIKEIV